MKKFNKLILFFLAIILITGCGNEEKEQNEDVQKEPVEQKLTCTTTESDEDMDIEQVISMTYKDDKLKGMRMEVNTKITNSTIKENWETFKKSMDENNDEYEKDGMSLKVVVDDKNYAYNTILDIDIDKASEEDLTAEGFEGLKDDDSTLEESKESAEKDGATCVVE